MLTHVCLAILAATPTFSLVPDVPDVGAEQGLFARGGFVYVIGDRYDRQPRVGEVVELDRESLAPTGRRLLLADDQGHPVAVHPTGLAWVGEDDCWVGETVKPSLTSAQRAIAAATGIAPPARAVLIRIDWPRAIERGTLEGCVRQTVQDDLAINGCRPITVTHGGRDWVATADYGDTRPTLRLYDPAALPDVDRTSALREVPRTLIGPHTQSLHFADGRVTCIQNVTPGRGWRLESFELAAAIAAGRADAVGTGQAVLTLPPTTELEGWLPRGREGTADDLFLIATRGPGLLVAE